MIRATIAQTVYVNGVYYSIYSDGTLARRKLGGTWEIVPIGEWPEVTP